MSERVKQHCPICGHNSWHETRSENGEASSVCLFCELLEQQLREGDSEKFSKNTSNSLHAEDLKEVLRNFPPFGGGLAGGG